MTLSFPIFAHEWDASSYRHNSASQFSSAHALLATYPIKAESRVLDVGCGDGKITAQIAQDFNSQVVGLDVSPNMIDYARTHFGGSDQLSFVLQDAATLNYNAEFDYVTSFTALQWVPKQDQALRGIFAALKPGGVFIATLPANYPHCLAQAILDTTSRAPFASHFNQFESGQVFFGKDEYAALLKSTGFVDVITELGPSAFSFSDVSGLKRFIAQWLPWAQVFTDPIQKEAYMNALMARYTAHCPAHEDGSVVFHLQALRVHGVRPFAKDEL